MYFSLRDLYISNITFVVIALFEVLINFKRPIVNKFYLLSIVVSIGIETCLRLFYPESHIYMAFALTNIIMTSAAFGFIFSLLNRYDKSKLNIILVINIFLWILLAYNLLSGNFLKNKTITNILNINFYEHISYKLRYFLTFLVIIPLIYCSFKLRSYYLKSDNIYHLKLIKWGLVIFILSIIILLFRFVYFTKIWITPFSFRFFIGINRNIILLVLMLRPEFLNKVGIKMYLGSLFDKKEFPTISKADFLHIFSTEMYYLKKEASLENLSKTLKISSDDLYQFIYIHFDMTFTDLINSNRIAYFIELIKKGYAKDYTIDTLAQMSGFSSRHHLYKPFKKFHGGTPSDLILAN